MAEDLITLDGRTFFYSDADGHVEACEAKGYFFDGDAGFQRDETDLTVDYPGALRPQAWAAAAPLSCLRTMLGLDIIRGRLRWRATVPDRLSPLTLRGIRVRGKEVNV